MTTVWARGVESDAERLEILANAPSFPGRQILGLLSHGNDLNVFDVWCTARRARCVLKVVRPDRVAVPGVLTHFQRERDLLLRLTHPHIVRAYETGEAPLPYLLEEALCGDTLSNLLGRRGLGWTDLLHLTDHLTSALTYLHDQDILHLDLKPSNIVAEGGRAKLIDFNLARNAAVGPADWGTPGYYAPEQETGGMFTTATDVWGLGAVLKEAARWSVPRAFRRLIRRSLSVNPSERPTLGEFRSYLATALNQPHFDIGVDGSDSALSASDRQYANA
ncbi:hypothetical protein BH10ACT2_BH10ACT2_26000 [soil metagenome]